MSILSSLFFSRNLACLIGVWAVALMGGCASRPAPPEMPIVQLPRGDGVPATAARLDALLPADVLLIGEQHNAAEHQQLEQQVIALLAARGLLAAVALEMAEAGVSTASLQPSSTEEQTRHALKWDNKGWPWAAYGPVVMTAVRAGVPVLGANLPRSRHQDSINDSQLERQLPGPALKVQQQRIRVSHCDLLPESQLVPMARLQIAKDITMANMLSQAALPGKVVVLLTGSGHADRTLGVPLHLPADLRIKAIQLRAGDAAGNKSGAAFNSVWLTPALPEMDYCADLRKKYLPK